MDNDNSYIVNKKNWRTRQKYQKPWFRRQGQPAGLFFLSKQLSGRELHPMSWTACYVCLSRDRKADPVAGDSTSLKEGELILSKELQPRPRCFHWVHQHETICSLSRELYRLTREKPILSIMCACIFCSCFLYRAAYSAISGLLATRTGTVHAVLSFFLTWSHHSWKCKRGRVQLESIASNAQRKKQ